MSSCHLEEELRNDEDDNVTAAGTDSCRFIKTTLFTSHKSTRTKNKPKQKQNRPQETASGSQRTHRKHSPPLKSLFPITFWLFVNSISMHCETWNDTKETIGKCLVEEKTDNVALFSGGVNRGICSTRFTYSDSIS